MNRIAMINFSPRGKKGVSHYLFEELKKLINVEVKIDEFVFKDFKKNQLLMNELVSYSRIIFIAPLYVDGLPSDMISFLQDFELIAKAVNKPAIKLYGMINCGFIEGTQNALALEMLQHFAAKANLEWGGGLGIGGGEFMHASQSMPLQFFVKKPVLNGLITFANTISARETLDSFLLVNAKLPKPLFLVVGTQFWNSWATKNGLKKKDMLARYYQEL